MKCVNLINISNKKWKEVEVSEAVIRRCPLKNRYEYLNTDQNNSEYGTFRAVGILCRIPSTNFHIRFKRKLKNVRLHAFSCSFSKIFQNNFFVEHQRVITSHYFTMFWKCSNGLY